MPIWYAGDDIRKDDYRMTIATRSLVPLSLLDRIITQIFQLYIHYNYKNCYWPPPSIICASVYRSCTKWFCRSFDLSYSDVTRYSIVQYSLSVSIYAAPLAASMSFTFADLCDICLMSVWILLIGLNWFLPRQLPTRGWMYSHQLWQIHSLWAWICLSVCHMANKEVTKKNFYR